MPLIQGCSVDAAEENYKKLLSEDMDKDQAFAVALKVAQDNMSRCSKQRQREIKNGDLFGDS